MMAYQKIRELSGVELAEYLLINANKIANALEQKYLYEEALKNVLYTAEMNPNSSAECANAAREGLSPGRIRVSNMDFARTAREARNIVDRLKREKEAGIKK